MMNQSFSSDVSSLAGSLTNNVCGTDYSYNVTVINYKYYCDGILVSIIGCLGVLGKCQVELSNEPLPKFPG